MGDTAKRQWKKGALKALHEAKTEEQLKAWEDSFAPKEKPGRPKVSKLRSHTSSALRTKKR